MKEKIIKIFEKYDPVNEDYEKIRNMQLFYFTLGALSCLLALAYLKTDVRISTLLVINAVVCESLMVQWSVAEVRKKIEEIEEAKQWK